MKKNFIKELNSCNDTNLKRIQKIHEYSKFVDPIHVNFVAFDFRNAYIMNVFELSFESKNDILEKIEFNKRDSEKKFNEIIVELDDLKNKVDSHYNGFCDFISGFVDGYVTLRKICDNSKIYMFVKNCQISYDEESGYNKCTFNGITAEQGGTTSIEADPRVYILSKMTEDEFNHNYFPARIRLCGLTSEVELSRYAVDLNEHFSIMKNLI